MGNKASTLTSKDPNVFSKELHKLDSIVSAILTEQNMFKDRAYNFLSQDVCDQHFVLMENELQRHLKVELQGVGHALYLIPKEGDSQSINKKDLCRKISNHYMKILYVLCLIKYVYNLEHRGEMSIAGIMFRNMKVVDDMIEINFCNVPHKDYSKSLKDAYKIDFSKLEGLEFFTKYFLEPAEAHAFLKVLRKVLARSPKKVLQKGFCEYIQEHKPSVEHLKQMETLYVNRFNENLHCTQKGGGINLHMYVEKDNPVFSREHCYEIHKYIIKLNTAHGAKVKAAYEKMSNNYRDNIKAIEKLTALLVNVNKNGSFTLKDLSKDVLESVIHQVKDIIKTFYLQSILDFHSILDIGKTTPNISMVK